MIEVRIENNVVTCIVKNTNDTYIRVYNDRIEKMPTIEKLTIWIKEYISR